MKKILVLDDNQDIHQLFKLDFNNSDYVIDYTDTIKQALKKLNEEVYFCTFINIFINDNKTSEEVIKFLKNEDSGLNHYLPIIIISSRIYKNKTISLTLKNPNIFTTITKPFTKKQLLRTISRPHENSVLLIDDDPDIHAYFKSLLLKENYQVYSTMTAHHGIAFLENMDFSGTFINQQLNDITTSKEIIKYINKHYQDKKHKFKLISSNKNIHDEKINKIKTLQKPLMPKQIFEALEINKEDVQVFTNTNEIKEETQIINKSIEEDESIQVISDSNEEEDDFKITISSSKDEKIVDDIIKVKKSSDPNSNNNDHSITVKNKNFDNNNNDFIQVKKLKQSPEEQVKGLLNQDDINDRNEQGLTPLMIFSFINKTNLINNAILKDADLKLKNKNKKTPLHFTSQNRSLESVEKLILHNTKINTQNNNQYKPIYNAIIAKNEKIVEYLLKNNTRLNNKVDDKSYLFYTVKINSPNITKVLYKTKLNPQKNELKKNSPLQMTLKKNIKKYYKIMSKFTK